VTLSPVKMRLLRALEVLADTSPFRSVDLPFRVESRANDHRSNHWGPRAKTSKLQRSGTYLALMRTRAWAPMVLLEHYLVVRVVRIAPRELDGHDNLGHSLKAITDGVADALRVNDRDPRVTFVPDAERGPWGARVEFYLPRES
jgi:hypothetical protein